MSTTVYARPGATKENIGPPEEWIRNTPANPVKIQPVWVMSCNNDWAAEVLLVNYDAPGYFVKVLRVIDLT